MARSRGGSGSEKVAAARLLAHGTAQRARSWWMEIVSGFLTALRYVLASARRAKCGTCVGVFTVALVVGFTALLQATVSQSPLIFLKLAEDSVGENDLVMLSDVSESNRNPFINFTDVQERLRFTPDVRGAVPRWFLLGSLVNKENNNLNTTVAILIIDSKLEDQARLGRKWNRRPLGENEAYASATALREIGVTGGIGQEAILRVSLSGALDAIETQGGGLGDFSADSLDSFFDDAGIELPDITLDVDAGIESLLSSLGINVDLPDDTYDITIGADILLAAALNATFASDVESGLDLAVTKEVNIIDEVDDPEGKWPSAIGNVVVLEAKYLASWVKSLVTDALDTVEQVAGFFGERQQVRDALQPIYDELDRLNYGLLKQYTLQVVVQYKPRDETYLQSYETIKEDIGSFSNVVFDSLGVQFPVTVTAPLLTTLEGSRFFRMFLDQIFGGVVFLLLLLGVLVIYALILGDVEAKTYEYGMLRVLGMRHRTLAQLISVQTLLFSVPGIAIGLSIAALLNLWVAAAVADFSGIDPVLTMPASAWLAGFLIGSIMPSLANVVPIRRALSSTLREAIDLYHQSFSEVTVTVQKLAKLGLHPWQIALSMMLIIIGFVTYYLIPLSFVLREFSIFLTILNAILLGMLLGLTLVAQALQPYLEKGVLWLMVWGKDSNLLTVIRKNLSGHQSRNRKTAYMISIATAFIVFAGALFELQNLSIQDNVKMFIGADLVVRSRNTDYDLPQREIIEYLNSVSVPSEAGPAIVYGHSFITFPLRNLGSIKRGRTGNLINSFSSRGRMYGLQSNYLSVTYDEFAVATKAQNPSDEDNIIQSLHAGAGRIVLPIERSMTGPPRSLVTGDILWTQYVCNVTSEHEAQQVIRDFSAPSFYSYSSCSEFCAPGTCYGATSNRNLTEQDIDVQTAYANYIDVVASDAQTKLSAVATDTPLRLAVRVDDEVNDRSGQRVYLAKARGFVEKLPGFFFSSYSRTGWRAPVILRMQDYARLLRNAYADIDSLEAGGGIPIDEADDQDGDADSEGNDTPGGQINNGGTGTGTGTTGDNGDSEDSGSRPSTPTNRAPGVWVASEPRWTVDGSSLYASPPPLPGHNASFALDNNPATTAEFPSPAPPAFIGLDLQDCLAVDGVRFKTSSASYDMKSFVLQSAPELKGPYTNIASGSVSESGDASAYRQFEFGSFSSRFWRFYATSNFADDTTGVVIPDLEFKVGVARVCDADLVNTDDLSIGVPKQRVMIRMRSDSSAVMERVVNAIRNVVDEDYVDIIETTAILQSANDVAVGLNGFFTFVATLCLILIFFASWLSFDSNIRENSREFGILRSLGLSKFQVTRAYLYEALSVVLSSFFMGTAIGLLIAISLTLQFNLFTELPFKFVFPTGLFVLTFVMSTVVATVSSLVPARRLASLTIANVVKGRS